MFNQIPKIMFSKPRIIFTFAFFVIIYFFHWVFYTYLAVDFFVSQMITDVSRGNDMLLLPLTIVCLIIAYLFLSIYEKWGVRFMQRSKWYSIRSPDWSLFWSRYWFCHVRNRNVDHCDWTSSRCCILSRNICSLWCDSQYRL